MSKLFKGTFNWANESYEMYTHCHAASGAFYNFIAQLSRKLEVGKTTLLFRFDGSRDNYFIEEVKPVERDPVKDAEMLLEVFPKGVAKILEEVKEDESKDSKKDS